MKNFKRFATVTALVIALSVVFTATVLIPGTIYAQVYTKEDGAYTLKGTIDANGTATLDGSILRNAASVTLFQ